MKMKYGILFLSMMFFGACQQSGQNDSSAGSQETSEEQFRDRPTGQQEHNWTFLTNKLFHYKAKVTIGQQVKKEEYEGQWIDLEDDGTFETGRYGKTDYAGEWSYEHGEGVLTLFPDPKTEKNSQWKVKYSDDVVILVGTPKYGDNATQVQLVRRTDKPSASR